MNRWRIIRTGMVLLACALRTDVGACGQSIADPPRPFPFRESGEDGKWGYMDRHGKTVVKPRFDRACDFADGLAFVVLQKQRMYIDGRGAVKVTVPTEWRQVRPFSEGLAACLVNDKWGFFDRQGKVVIQPRYDAVGDFREGLARIAVGMRIRFNSHIGRQMKVGGKCGYIDEKGREIVKPIFRTVSDFHEGLAYVLLEGGIGYIDKRGRVVIRLDHDVKDYPKQYKFYGGRDFSEGLARIEVANAGEGYYRYIDKAGEFVPREKFPNLCVPFSEGLAPFTSEDKWGYIDRAGHIVCKAIFDEADCFSEGLAAVRVGEYWGYVDRQMRFIVRPEESRSDGRGRLNDVEPFSGGLARVHIGGFFDGGGQFGCDWLFGTWFYMNEHGDLIRRVRHDNESGPGYGQEYRRYGIAPEISEEMKRAWEKLQSRRD